MAGAMNSNEDIAGRVDETAVQPSPSETPNATDIGRPRRWSLYGLLLLTLLGGAALRGWIITTPNIGHLSDLGFFVDWMRGLSEHGLAGFYTKEVFCDYPPLSVLLFWTGGKLTAAFHDGALRDADLRVAIKCMSCAADLVIAVLLFFETLRRIGHRSAVAAAALYLLNPAVIYNSAYWGQVDSIYTAFVLAALIAVGRRGFGVAGALVAAALGAKFQTIALVPLVIFEAYRLGGWRGLGRWFVGGALAFTVILTPFGTQGVMFEALRRSYVNVVGQYHELSKSAFNIWFFTDDPKSSDTNPPAALVRAAAGGALQVSEDATFWLKWSWRKISLVLYATVVAIILSLYSLRPGGIARYAAAGLLAVAFFLFPTEMHERYAFPALALLVVWAVSSANNERLYWLVTAALLLNLAAKLPPESLAEFLAVCFLTLFGFILGAMVFAKRFSTAQQPDENEPYNERHSGEVVSDDGPSLGRPWPILTFRSLTAIAVVFVAVMGVWMQRTMAAALPSDIPGDAAFLSDLLPLESQQGWKTLANDHSVAGGLIRMNGMIYLRGIGTHAPARMLYDIPKGVSELRMLAGIDAVTDSKGSAVVRVELDGKRVYSSGNIIGGGPPTDVAVRLGNARRAAIIVEDAGDGRKADHVDLALARFVRTSSAASATTAPTTSSHAP